MTTDAGQGADGLRFIVDHNVGKLARWLRMLGYDSLFFTGDDDGQMVKLALAEDRIILTRDAGIMKRRAVDSGRVTALLLSSETPEHQMRQIMGRLDLAAHRHPFTLCLECNRPLIPRSRSEVAGRVPDHVYRTQEHYVECTECHRIYWRGTHWAAMVRKLESLLAIVEGV